MPDARIVQPIPGEDFRPDDLVVEDDDGAILLVRVLSEDETRHLNRRRDCLCIFHPNASWLSDSIGAPGGQITHRHLTLL